MKEQEMKLIGAFIDRAIKNADNDTELGKIRMEVEELAKRFPLYS